LREVFVIRSLCFVGSVLAFGFGSVCALADGAWNEVQFVPIGSPVVGLHESGGELYAGVPESGIQAGAVLRLGRRGSEYQLLAGPAPSQSIQGAHFGAALRVQGDLAVVGEPRDAFPAGPGIGLARVFTRQGDNWVESGYYLEEPSSSMTRFPKAVAIAGSFPVLTAPMANSSTGRGYMYREVNSQWSYLGSISAFDGENFDQFGLSVAATDSTIAVGAPTAELDPAKESEGAVYMFSSFGGAWVQTARLSSADQYRLGQFGSAISLNGSRLIVGAVTEPLGAMDGVGAAYVFEQIAGSWTQVARFESRVPDYGNLFGIAVSIKGDVACVVSTESVGTSLGDGVVYVFQNIDGIWTDVARFGPVFEGSFSACAISGSDIAVSTSRSGIRGVSIFSERLFTDNFDDVVP
jgi:hypothetical protein